MNELEKYPPFDQDETRLVDAWIKLQRAREGSEEFNSLIWSATALWRMGRASPIRCFEVVLGIIKSDSDELILANAGAGPLERLLTSSGAQIIDRVEQEAKENPGLSKALGMVWKGRIPDDIWQRIIQVASPEKGAGSFS